MIVLFSLLAGCRTSDLCCTNYDGSSSCLEHSGLSTIRFNKAAKDACLKFCRYQKVVINDFTDGVTRSKNDLLILRDGRYFADLLALKLKKDSTFHSVLRNTDPGPDTLVIEGQITEYVQGDIFSRIISHQKDKVYFGAIVYFKDSQTKCLLGSIVVERADSLAKPLSAAVQDMTDHIKEIANGIGNEIRKTREKRGSQGKNLTPVQVRLP